MEVVHNIFTDRVEFSEIVTGSCFFYEEELYMKTANCFTEYKDIPMNAVSLEDGLLAFFNPWDLVIPVKAKVIVETK